MEQLRVQTPKTGNKSGEVARKTELRHKVSLSALHKGRIEINTQGTQEERTSEKQNKFHG